MSYSYLIDLYQLIDERLCTIDIPSSTVPNAAIDAYQEGRRDCLLEFRNFIRQKYHHKLPRRIQKSYTSYDQKNHFE